MALMKVVDAVPKDASAATAMPDPLSARAVAIAGNQLVANEIATIRVERTLRAPPLL
jgi:hypothetical protein